MDIYSAVCNTAHLIHVTFVFIQGVVDDYKNYDADARKLRNELRHEMVFHEQFREKVFNGTHGAAVFEKQPQSIQDDCTAWLNALNDSLAKYREQAQRHGLEFPLQNGSAGPAAQPTTPNDTTVSFRMRMKQKLSDLDKKGVKWSLFDKKELAKLTEEVRKIVTSLRENLYLMSTIAQFDLSNFEDKELKEMIRRRAAAESDPDPTFLPMTGSVDVPAVGCQKFGIANYLEGSFTKQIIYDIREYDRQQKSAAERNDENRLADLLKLVIKLAWWLWESRFQEGIDASDTCGGVGPTLGLDFFGYLDQAKNFRTVFMYELPEQNHGADASVKTLYDLINHQSSGAAQQPRQSLGNRFYIAHAAAVTVLNVHISLWVHKNIRSSSFVVQKRNNSKFPSRRERPVPFITSWGVARRRNDPTDLADDLDIIANLYRHPDRQGRPSVGFNYKHDIYSLGVVLAEIGLWSTVDKMFQHEIVRGRVASWHFKEWWKTKGKPQITKTMGEAYVEVINFYILERPQVCREEGLLEFRNQVVNVLARAIDL